jgi:hypothetical protein
VPVPTRATRRLVAAAVVLVGFLAGPATGQEPVHYEPPVDGPVVDPFRPPATPYGPGNRGLEVATTPGSPVRAAAAGRVTFAGVVAGERFVTVQHADGIRTTYGRLASVGVRQGSDVASGDVVGTAGRRTIWTARLGVAYVDPAVLLDASAAFSVRLVPNRPVAEGRRPLSGPPRPAPAPVPSSAAAWALEGVREPGSETAMERTDPASLCCRAGLAPARPSTTHSRP